MWMQIHDITFSKPCADLEEGVGGVFGLGQIKVEYLHSNYRKYASDPLANTDTPSEPPPFPPERFRIKT